MKTTSGNRTRSRRAVGALIGAATLGLAACGQLPTHLHDPERQSVAESIQSELRTYAQNAPKMYVAMQENLESFKVEEEALLADLAATADRAMQTRLPSLTFSEWCGAVETDAEDTARCVRPPGGESLVAGWRSDIAALDELVVTETEQLDRALKDALGRRKGAADAVGEHRKLVAEAKAAVDERSRNVAFFEAVLSKVPPIAVAGDGAEDFSAVLSRAKTAGATEFEFPLVGGSCSGDKSEDGKTCRTTVRDTLAAGVEAALEADDTALGRFARTPGLAIEVATLGLRIEQARLSSALLDLDHLQRRQDLLEDAYSAIRLSEILLDEGEQFVTTAADGLEADGVGMDTTVYKYLSLRRATAPAFVERERDTGKVLAASALTERKVGAAHGVLVALRYHALASSMVEREKAMLPVALARLDHERSITQSMAADAAWQALVQSGAAGLVAFHRTGWKPEHLANLLRLAQAAALIAIAL